VTSSNAHKGGGENGRTILLLTTVLPGAESTGGEVASSAFIGAMRAAGHRVVALGYRREGSRGGRGVDDWEAGPRRIETREAGLRPLGWVAAALVLRMPYSLAKYRGRRYRRAVEKALVQLRPSLVVVDHAQTAWVVPRNGFGAPFVYLAHNVEHHLYRDAAEHGQGPVRWINKRESRYVLAVERRLVRDAVRVWTLSGEDARELEKLASCRPPRSFGLPSNVAERREEMVEHDVALLGTWTWGANAAGLRWFLAEVQPLLPSGTRVGVGGVGGREVVGERSGIVCLGRVPDAGEFLARAGVIAIPATAGSGVQVKTLDAIASGRPTVATPLAMRGIDEPPASVRIADDPAGFAAAVTESLSRPPRPQETEAARAWSARRRSSFAAAVSDAIVSP